VARQIVEALLVLEKIAPSSPVAAMTKPAPSR